jgi:hypothetical protein
MACVNKKKEAAFPKTKLKAYTNASTAMASTIVKGVEKFSLLDKVIKKESDGEKRISAF